MENSTKIILGIALLSTLGIGSLARAVSTIQAKSPVAVISAPHKPYQVAEAAGGDGDGETNDDAQEQQEKDVKVDAGNGKVLYTEANEKTRPHSSIRISEDANGDGDGETNDDG